MWRIFLLLVVPLNLVHGWIHRQQKCGILGAPSRAHVEQSAVAPQTAAELRELYPASVAFRNGSLQVDDVHCLHYEIHGRQDEASIKALFLHGGPGAGCSPNHARFFDPKLYQIVLLDQRGSGKSQPKGEIRDNTLGHLVEDCETLRKELKIERWDVVLGGSWGTTLAIAYAQTYPKSVRAMILRGICLLRTAEVDWLFASHGGAAKQWAPAWKSFTEAVGVDDEVTLENPRSALHAYYNKFMGSNETERWNAARSWMKWEFFMSVSHKIPLSANISDTNTTMKSIKSWNHSESPVAAFSKKEGWRYEDAEGNIISPEAEQQSGIPEGSVSIQNHFRQGLPLVDGHLPQTEALAISNSAPGERPDDGNIPAQNMLTCYYSTNHKFCMNNVSLLDPERIQRIRSIPCVAVHGGCDRICPPDTALDLSEAWPEMALRIPILAGHSMYDPFNLNELIRTTDYFGHDFACEKGVQ